jgi:RHH-type proline utilization regulon transcriptional repressor/proline dehydrogenase/delta 1-pyrroline-5-carboxylate dehydrogenase
MIIPSEESSSREPDILRLGGEIWKEMQGEVPGVFNKDFWQGRILEWAMRDPSFRVDMFRLVDVLPVLKGRKQVWQHLKDYLIRPGRELPTVLSVALKAASGGLTGMVAVEVIKRNVEKMAENFIIGHDAAEAIPVLRKLHAQGIGFTADLLGEATLTEGEAKAYIDRYRDLIGNIADEVARWKPDPVLGRNHLGPIPVANVSLKLSALDCRLDPVDTAGCVARLKEKVLPLFLLAKEKNVFLNVDLENSQLHGITYALFEELLSHPELKSWPHLGIVVQAYLVHAAADVDRLLSLAKSRGAPLTVRLVKGAYWDYEVATSRQWGLPCPVLTDKAATDAQYEALSRVLLANADHLAPAFGSHNLRSLVHALVAAEELKLPREAYEIQMLYGMAEPERKVLRARGHRLRVYSPVGALLPGMAYLVRRLLENTSNSGFLRLSYHDGEDIQSLLAAPGISAATGSAAAGSPSTDDSRAMTDPSGNPIRLPDGFFPGTGGGEFLSGTAERFPGEPGSRRPGEVLERMPGEPAGPRPRGEAHELPDGLWEPFANCPKTDFALEENREAYRRELEAWKARFPLRVPLVRDGREEPTAESFDWFSPNDLKMQVARVSMASAAQADEAVEAAERGYLDWRDLAAEKRAALAEALADILEQDRISLAALQSLETAKPWQEADLDVAEAVDFCRYYARRSLIELAPRDQGRVPGERNILLYQGRGPTVVIAPWNFPLAILCGMSVAALTSGNPVVMKPAEQSSAMAYRLFKAMLEAGYPPGVVQFVPGSGEEAGARLVAHPKTAQVAFTGSLRTGTLIMGETAQLRPGQTRLKRVICETGGKNAIVIDDDADLDEAVAGVLKSAFGFAGQKCSAASRVIVVGDAYPAFVERLAEACRSLRILSAESPACDVPPVIDGEAKARLDAVTADPGPGARLLYKGLAPEGGHYVAPALFEVIDRGHRLMQEELFGPVLAAIRASNFEEALDIALATPFALTGAVFTRSPSHLEAARHRFRVGNLYLNRGSTGALVERQPFGGFGHSGLGTKAGGPGYLMHFVEPYCITENTMRHGFTPDIQG